MRSQADSSALFSGGSYLGLVTLDDVKTVMLAAESMPLLLAGDLVRSEIPPLTLLDTLETAFESFARHEVDYLPVFAPVGNTAPTLLGLLSRSDLMRRYHMELSGS